MNAKVLLDYLNEFENSESVEISFCVIDGGSGECYELDVEETSLENGEYIIELKENKRYLKDKFGFPFDKLAELISLADETFKELKDEYYSEI